MIKKLPVLIAIAAFVSISFKNFIFTNTYLSSYFQKQEQFKSKQAELLNLVEGKNLQAPDDIIAIKKQIHAVRLELKELDFWFRYLEPTAYKMINGPLPVEWEVEVFEDFAQPYRRKGAGLTLAEMYLEEGNLQKDSLLKLIRYSLDISDVYLADSITEHLDSYHHFYLCNRLFLLNLAAIYTTGFECPDPERVIPEVHHILAAVKSIYADFNQNFPQTPLTSEYITLYSRMITFVERQSSDNSQFDHFTFIKDYVNPLFSLNQDLIRQYKVVSKSYIDYSLSKKAKSIFSKSLFHAQNPKGIFLWVDDEETLAEIDRVGKLLFYDPILSGNNLRSCASCHKPTEYFTDTQMVSPLHFNRIDFLSRNSPTLINVPYNHLVMLDGKHISLQDQTKAVILNPEEMGSLEKELIEKVLSCSDYNKTFKSLLKHTPQEKEVTLDHISSAITFYYSKFSKTESPFDEAMNNKKEIDPDVKEGFNLFMSKAQCVTCHFVPQFNGVKPPYTNSEFEVLGVPGDIKHSFLSKDSGRFKVHSASEMKNAFRTNTIRNTQFTRPYMHNGVFSSLLEVIEFYNAGGGAGRGLDVSNQTLATDSLNLTKSEKYKLILFIQSLSENIPFENDPEKLPVSKNKALNSRKVGGEY